MVYLQRGEIWNIKLNMDSEDIVGHEQGKIRPCFVIKMVPQVKLAAIIPFTSVMAVSRFPYTHYIQVSTQNGLTSPSIAMIFQIRSVSFKRFLNKVGILEKDDWDSIYNLIEDYLFT